MGLIKRTKKRSGVALIIALIFVLLLSAMAVCFSTFAGNSLEISFNQQKMNRALETAQSGLEFIQFWFSGIALPATTLKSNRFEVFADSLQSDTLSSGIYITKTADSNGLTESVELNNIAVNQSKNQTFSVNISKTSDIDVLQVDITGDADSFQRRLRMNFNFDTRASSVFDYGVATKGPLSLSGNIELTGTNVAVEADVYIESENQDNALEIIGNSQIAGDVKITNDDAYVTLQGGQASIGGETGDDAIENHVSTGAAPTEFPIPMPTYFEKYIESTLDPDTTDTSSNQIFENVRIPSGMNPTFSGQVVITGVLFIEAPNIVTFTGGTSITGVIVGNGDTNDDSATNQLIFNGDVSSTSVSELGYEYGDLREETGTFLMAPGFKASFGGSFDTINGAIAANGIDFYGNAGGTINGSVVNYSDETMTLGGNGDLFFNRSGTTEIPSGFGPEIIIHKIPGSYQEIY